MIGSVFLCCCCLFSNEDFRNEVDIQVFKISEKLESTPLEDVYNAGYLTGKLDVYKSLQESMRKTY